MNQLTILSNIRFRKFEYYACLGLLCVFVIRLSSNQYRNEEDKTNRKNHHVNLQSLKWCFRFGFHKPQSMCH